MSDKDQALEVIRSYLRTGVLTESDLRSLFTTPEPAKNAPSLKTDDKLSAVDIMFYIAGIVFFAAIMSFIGQTWSGGGAFAHILPSLGTGSVLWVLAYSLLRSPAVSDIRRGLVNALLLTGSLLVVVGGYIVANEIVGGYGEINFIPGAIALGVVGAIHIWFDRVVKKDLILRMGVLAATAAFPAFIFGLLKEADAPSDLWSAVLIVSAGLLAYATRVVAKIYSDRQKVAKSFDAFAAFIALLTMYVSSYSGLELFWLIALIVSVLGVFYLCILFQSKNLLGIASLFMVVTVVTIAFRYFSDFGVSTSLIIATIGLLGSAAVASSINKKYLKQ